MRIAERTIIGVLVAAVSGCDVVTSTHPVGNLFEPVSVGPAQVDRGTWEGTWVELGGLAVIVTVLDPQKAIFRVSWVVEKKGGPRLVVREAHLRVFGEWCFGNFHADTEDTPTEVQYLWGPVKVDQEQLLLWTPSAEKFKRLVEEGILPGKVDKDGDVHLGELKQEHLVIITSDKRGILFEWDKPVVFWRVRK